MSLFNSKDIDGIFLEMLSIQDLLSLYRTNKYYNALIRLIYHKYWSFFEQTIQDEDSEKLIKAIVELNDIRLCKYLLRNRIIISDLDFKIIYDYMNGNDILILLLSDNITKKI